MKKPRFSLRRLITASISLLMSLVFILYLYTHLEKDSWLASLLLDYTSTNVLYPLSIQNIMWVMFFIGLGELWERLYQTRIQAKQLYLHYLPEDERKVLQLPDLNNIYQTVQNTADLRLFLPSLIKRVILQFNSSRAIDQASLLLNSSLELYLHEIDLNYNMLRYITWLIPTLGFIGTVVGISIALNYAGAHVDDAQLLGELTRRLAVAFYTTLLALLQATVITFGLYMIQAWEERCLNHAGQYCLDNLINRLYIPNAPKNILKN